MIYKVRYEDRIYKPASSKYWEKSYTHGETKTPQKKKKIITILRWIKQKECNGLSVLNLVYSRKYMKGNKTHNIEAWTIRI